MQRKVIRCTDRRRFQKSTSRHGLTLLETAVSTLIVGVLMIAALRAVGMSIRTGTSIERQQRGMVLVDHLMSEILRRDYREPGTVTGPIGLEAFESPVGKQTFDDIDDYDGWTESPPQLMDGTPISGLEAWSREVDIENVDPTDTTIVLSDADDRGVRRIRVTAKWNGHTTAQCQSLESDAFRAMARQPYQPFVSQP